MSKKHKSHYVDHGMKVVAVGETITFDKKEDDHMDKDYDPDYWKWHDHKEWFYLNDITWYKSTDGRVVAPVKGVVKNIGKPILNSDYVLVSVAEKAIVDAAPFGACYDHEKLMALCAHVKISADLTNCDADGREPYVLASKVVEAENEKQKEAPKDCTDEENRG